MSKGLYVHDYDALEAPNPDCCDDPGILCTNCARLALLNNANSPQVFYPPDDEEDDHDKPHSFDEEHGFGEESSFNHGIDRDLLIPPRTFADLSDELERKYPALPKDTGSNSDVTGFDPDALPEHLHAIFDKGAPRSPSPRRTTRNRREVALNYIGCGGGYLPHYSSARRSDDEPFVAPTINYAELSKEHAANCGCKGLTANTEPDKEKLFPLPVI